MGGSQHVRVVPGFAPGSVPIFSVLVKRSYRIVPDGRAERLDAARPLLEGDVYYDDGDPEWSTVLAEADLVPYKVATDVVFIGRAYAPRGQAVEVMDVGVEVTGVARKVVRVIGDRRCFHRPGLLPGVSDPTPFVTMDIRYERAYGGEDRLSNPELPFHYPRNGLGRGIAVLDRPDVVDGLALPNIEDPADLLGPDRIVLGDPDNWYRQPLPQGFGWFQKTWYPRCSHAGSIPGTLDPDTVMPEERLGLVPPRQLALHRQRKLPSFDHRFNSGASPGLSVPYLRGDETIRTRGLVPEGDLAFQLPGETPHMMLDIGLGENEMEGVLHTVCLRIEDRELDMVWRGAHEYPGFDWLPEMTKLHVEAA